MEILDRVADTHTDVLESIDNDLDLLTESLVKRSKGLPLVDLFTDEIDLNETFVEQPDSSFLIRVQGESMIGAGIEPGDTLLVDTTRKPVHNDIVVASVNGLLTVKKLHYSYMETILFPENDDYFPIILKGRDRLDIWGVARLVIKTL